MNIAPVTDRIDLLDVLRGFAIFGMFTVNMTADASWADAFSDAVPWQADFVSLLFVDLFTNGKFITLFSLLFGLGFYIQSQRRMHKGLAVAPFWVRRLAGLFLIGAAATALTLPTRILIDYSLFGLALLAFYRLSPGKILAAAISCFIVERVYGPVLHIYWPDLFSSTPTMNDEIHAAASMVESQGSFLEISQLEILHLWNEITSVGYFVGDLGLLGLMLIGLYVGRKGALTDPDTRRRMARAVMPWLLGVGFASCVLWVAMTDFGLGDSESVHHEVLVHIAAWPFGMAVLGLGYAAAVTLLLESPRWSAILGVFAPIGRMALTNYLFTAFVSAVVGFQWGFGLYGKVSPTAGLAIVVALLPVQMLASRWWLSRFRYGPAEWLWRAWTYGAPPRMVTKVA